MTSEGKSDTEPWIKEKGVKYAYGYDKGGKFARTMGVSGIPHAFLVNAQGEIAWQGHPAELNEDIIKKATTGSLKKPLWELGKQFAPVKAAFVKGDYATALKAAKTLQGDEAAQVATALESLVSGLLKSAERKKAEGDVLGAQRDYTKLSKGVKGLPEEQAVTAALGAIGKDPEAQKNLKLQKELERLLDMPSRSGKDKSARREALESFAAKNPGTYAAAQAKKSVSEQLKDK